MSQIKKFPLLLYLLSKRLYKKVSFIIILAALVLVTLFCKVALSQESSMLKIAVVSDPENAIAAALLESSGAVSYKSYDREEAQALLNGGRVDAALEFAEDFEEGLLAFAAGEEKDTPIQVTVREKNIFINLAMERVYAELYPVIAEQYYHRYGRDTLGIQDEPGLQEAYESLERNDEIISFAYYNSDEKVEQTNYLLTPMRGMLAVLLAFCAMASCLYFLTDCENGNMDATPIHRRWPMQNLYTLTGTVNVAVFVMLCLAVTGMMGNLGLEIAVMLLYVVACTGFATLVSGIVGRTTLLSSVMPILTIGMLAVCPVFLNSKIPVLPWMFPAYWYLTAVYNASKIPMMLVYCLVVCLLSYLLWRNRKYTK